MDVTNDQVSVLEHIMASLAAKPVARLISEGILIRLDGAASLTLLTLDLPFKGSESSIVSELLACNQRQNEQTRDRNAMVLHRISAIESELSCLKETFNDQRSK